MQTFKEMITFVICVPLQTLDAETICEAILQETFGPPFMLITDAAKSRNGKLVELFCSALSIDRKVICVCSHGSLQFKKAYSYTSNVPLHLLDHSPYE